MSRAYRIQVRESIQTVIRAADHVSTRLELLGVLPPERMSELLAAELERRGYERRQDRMRKTSGKVLVEVELRTGTVTVRAEAEQTLELNAERETLADTDWSDTRKSQIEQNLKRQVQHELTEEASNREAELQKEITSRLEQELGNLRQELNAAVNRATGEALKERAAQIGQIKSVDEDPQGGSLTIVVEV